MLRRLRWQVSLTLQAPSRPSENYEESDYPILYVSFTQIGSAPSLAVVHTRHEADSEANLGPFAEPPSGLESSIMIYFATC